MTIKQAKRFQFIWDCFRLVVVVSVILLTVIFASCSHGV